MGACNSSIVNVQQIKTPTLLKKNYKASLPFSPLKPQTYCFTRRRQSYTWQLYDGTHHIVICINGISGLHMSRIVDIFIFNGVSPTYIYYTAHIINKICNKCTHPWTLYDIRQHNYNLSHVMDISTWRDIIKLSLLPQIKNDNFLHSYKTINMAAYYKVAACAQIHQFTHDREI